MFELFCLVLLLATQVVQSSSIVESPGAGPAAPPKLGSSDDVVDLTAYPLGDELLGLDSRISSLEDGLRSLISSRKPLHKSYAFNDEAIPYHSGYKRVVDTSSSFMPWSGKRSSGNEEKRFQAWAGKRADRLFRTWGGKRDVIE